MNNQLIDPCQPIDEWVNFHTRKRCEDYVLKMQRRLDQAVRDNDIDKIRYITIIHEGFDFLGYNIRKYRETSPYCKYHSVGKLLIKPQKEKVQTFLFECGAEIRTAKGKNLEHLIRNLNPKLRGFTNYYRFVVSSEIFNNLDKQIKDKIFRMLRKFHPNKSKKWVWLRYSTNHNSLKATKTFEMNNQQLYLSKFTPITRYTMVNGSKSRWVGSLVDSPTRLLVPLSLSFFSRFT